MEPLPSLEHTQRYAAQNIAALPKDLCDLNARHAYPIEISPRLSELRDKLRAEYLAQLPSR